MTYTNTEKFEVVYDWHEAGLIYTFQEILDKYGLRVPYLEPAESIFLNLNNGYSIMITRLT